MITVANHELCHDCETCAHCLKHGCIPKQPLCDTAFAPLRTNSGGATVHHGHQITLEGPEPDNWTLIGHALRWAGLCFALAATIGFAAGVLL